MLVSAFRTGEHGGQYLATADWRALAACGVTAVLREAGVGVLDPYYQLLSFATRPV